MILFNISGSIYNTLTSKQNRSQEVMRLTSFNIWISEGDIVQPQTYLWICCSWYLCVLRCSVIGCWVILRNIETGWKGKKHYAMNSTHFLLDISGEESGKWGSSEPMHGENPVRELIPFCFCCIFSKDSFGSTGPSPDAFHVRWFKHVCARLCAGLCEANYSWKQLLSQQLASSPSRITLL